MTKTQNVTIKGTKDGLLLHLNDQCSFSVLLEELQEMFPLQSVIGKDSHEVHLRISTGNRFLTEDQILQIKELLRPYKNLIIDSVDSNVILKEEANRIIEEANVTVLTSIVRSGQVIQVHGDLLVVGDVNPGGTIKASGNIYVLGKLQGIAHAGFLGDEEAVICAAIMVPSQLRIGGIYRHSPERDDRPHEPECAYLEENKELVIDRIQVLKTIRPNLTSFVGGGIHNG